MSWPQWSAATQPTVPPVINPAQPIINSAPTVVPPGLQYTPEQWAQLQQQNWSQWAQWQQQYQQWHQQYGAEYQKSMNALAQATQAQQPMGGLPNVAIPPPLPAEPKPPLPTEDPPPNVASYNTAPPPAPPSQPQPPLPQQGYNTAPPVRATEQRPPVHYPRNNQNQSWQNQNQYQNRYEAPAPPGPQAQNAPFGAQGQGPHRPHGPHAQSLHGPQGQGPHGPHAQILHGPQGPQHKRPYEQPLERDPTKRPMYNKPGWQNQPPPQARPRENIEELSEAEKKFDKQFAEWEAQFQKWKEQNVEHPDKEQYREYEKKWESWRAQLLERREQMKRKRLGLPIEKPTQKPGSTQSFNQTNQSYNSPQQNFNQVAQQGYNQASRPGPQQGYNQGPKQPQGVPPVGKPPAPVPQIPPGPGSQGQVTAGGTNPVPFAKPPPNMNDEPLKFKDDKAAPELEETVSDFIKPNTGGGIPGLDLVKDEPPAPKKQANDDVVVIDPEEKEKEGPEKKGPDFEAISKGINSILGDQKLLNMLSIVSQTQIPKTADNLTNTVSKITPESNSQNVFPEQSNQSFEEHSNHSATYNQREFVNNFDDQTRSSFTAHNDQETRFEPLGGLNKNQNQFPNRFGSNFQGNRFNNEPFKGPNQERFGGRDDRFGLGSDRFGPKQDRLGPNQDRFGPNQDLLGPGPDKFGPNQDRFGPSFDRPGLGPGPDKFGPQDRFGPNQERSDRLGSNQGRFGPNQDRFGPNLDRFGPDQDRFEQDKFGPNQNRFGPNQERFGGNEDRFGPNQDKMGPAAGRFGSGQDKFGSDQDRFEPGQDRFGPGQNRFGPNQDRFGPNQDRPGPGSDRFGPAKDRFGPNQGRFGPNQDKFGNNQDRFGPNQDRFGPNSKFGPNKDRFGANQDKFGPNQDKFGSNQDRFGPNQDRFGPNQDRFGPQRNAPDDRFGRNDGNFGSRGGPNQFGPDGGDNFDEEPYGESRYDENCDDYDYDAVAASFEHEEQHPPLHKEEPWKNDAGFQKEPWKKNKGYQQEPWKKGGGFQREPWKNDGNYKQERWEDQGYEQEPFEEDYGQESWQEDQGYEQQPPFEKPPPNDPKPESAEPAPPQEIFQPATVIDYEHKSIKPSEPEILIEPIHMFDYRHKPLSRIPLPQRPRWLSKAVKNIRDFDPPSIVRQYEPPRRYPAPKENWRNDRYQDSWGPGPHRGRGYEDRRPYTERSYDEPRGPKNDWNSPGPKNDWNSQKWEDRKPYNEEKNYRSEEKKPLFDYEEEKISDTEWPEDDDFEQQEKSDGTNPDLLKFQKPGLDNKPITKNTFLIEDLISPPGRYKRPPRIVIILRGPPGSGKTFLAKLIKDKEVENGGSAPRILSLDDYFMVEQEKEVTEEGKKVKVKEMVYEYEAEMEESYRTSLIKSFKKTITDGYFSFIIVDNVNDKVKYFGEMWSFAKQNGFQVYICQLDLDVQTCSKRNIHGRSEEDIQKCIANWEPTPSHHPVLDVTSLLQSASIPEVEMEEVNSPESEAPEHDGSEQNSMASTNPSDNGRWKSTSNWIQTGPPSNPPNPVRREFGGPIWKKRNNRRR